MNFLAHIYLSFGEKELMLGNFLADLLSHKETLKMPYEFQKGVSLHRFIDRYTDKQPQTIEAVSLLKKTQGRYAPVAHDILMDHLLYLNWHKYNEDSFIQVCDFFYSALNEFKTIVPRRHDKYIQTLLEVKWLDVYCTVDGLQNVMNRMNKRSRYPSNFEKSILQFEQNKEVFDTLFNDFFPEMIIQAKQYTAKLNNCKRSVKYVLSKLPGFVYYPYFYKGE